ncbi:MAG: sigma-70 family RNA polymerase sigma factor [Tenuifilaceae bacterium]|nr:sigma-70 family RNA polymerase sigma factor [Tenuifilaceae bacterium]
MEISKNILDRCCNNERKAQQLLYEMYSHTMYGVCLRYYPNAHIAQDILQDGFIRVFEKVKTYRREGSFEGWMRRIMVNTALEYHRKMRNYADLEISIDTIGDAQTQYFDADYQLLLNIIASLPQQYRLVFNLYAIEGYSHAEVASLLKISESTSKSNYSRARGILREKISLIYKFEKHAILRTGTI